MADRTVKVDIRGDSTDYLAAVERAEQATDRLADKVDRFSRGKHDATLGVDTDTAEARIKRLNRKAKDYSRESYSADFDANTAVAEEKARGLDTTLANVSRDRMARVDAQFEAARADANRLNAQFDRVARDRNVRFDPDFANARAEAMLLSAQLEEAAQDRTARIRLIEENDVRGPPRTIRIDMSTLATMRANPRINLEGGAIADRQMRNLIGLGMSMGPAITASAESGFATVFALLTTLSGAGVAGGALIGTFVGLKDALKAAWEHGANPTAESLKKVEEEGAKAGEHVGYFLLAVSRAREPLERLQKVARAGMLPGMADGIDEILEAMPQLEVVMYAGARAVGRLSEDAGASFNDPFWRKYFDFLATDAVPTFEKFVRGTGKFGAGIAGLQMALQPFTNDFINGYDRMGDSFANWAANLDSNERFQEFLDHARDIGPDVVSAIGDLALALYAVMEAARPLAPIVLDMISNFAEIVEWTFTLPGVGTALIGLATAIGTVRTAALLFRSVGLARLFSAVSAGSAAASAGAGGIRTFGNAMLFGRDAAEKHAGAIGRAGDASRTASGKIAGGADKVRDSAGKFDKYTRSADDANTKLSKFSGAAGLLGGPLGIAVGAVTGAAVAYDTYALSAGKAIEATQQGGQAALDASDDMREFDQSLQKARDNGMGWAADFDEWANGVLGLRTSTQQYNDELNRMAAELPPVESATLKASEAQRLYDVAVRDFGRNSPQAVQAMTNLKNAQADVELEQRLLNISGMEYYQTLGQITGEAGPAGDAARRMAAGFDAAELSAMGATTRIDETGRAVATLPNGKEIVLTAPATHALDQLQLVAGSVNNIPVGKTINVGVLNEKAIAMLRGTGVEVRELPDGTVEVTANTEQAKNRLNAIGRDAQQERQFKVSADPQKAYDSALKAHLMARTAQIFGVRADTSWAYRTIFAFWNSWAGRFITWTVRTVTGRAGGGPVGAVQARADGGPLAAANGAFVRKSPTRHGGTGRLSGAGSGTSDSVRLLGSAGEWVIRERVVNQQGAGAMTALNAGKAKIVPAYRAGGMVRAEDGSWVPRSFYANRSTGRRAEDGSRVPASFYSQGVVGRDRVATRRYANDALRRAKAARRSSDLTVAMNMLSSTRRHLSNAEYGRLHRYMFQRMLALQQAELQRQAAALRQQQMARQAASAASAQRTQSPQPSNGQGTSQAAATKCDCKPVVNNHVVVNNPLPETASDSTQRRLSRMADMGMFAGV